MTDNFRKELHKAIEKRERGEPLNVDSSTKEQANCYSLFYHLKPMNYPRVNVPLTAPGARMVDEFFSRHEHQNREIAPYGELKKDNPRVIALAASLKMPVQTFIDNVNQFQNYVDNYKPHKKK